MDTKFLTQRPDFNKKSISGKKSQIHSTYPENPVPEAKPKKKESENLLTNGSPSKHGQKKFKVEPFLIPGIKSDPTQNQKASAKNKKSLKKLNERNKRLN